MVKKLVTLLMAVVMLATMFTVTSVFAADYDVHTATMKLTAPTGEINVGDRIQIPMTLSNINGLEGIQIRVKWNPEYLYMDGTQVTAPGFPPKKYYTYYPDAADTAGAFFTSTSYPDFTNAGAGLFNYAGMVTPAWDFDYEAPLGTLHFDVLEAAAGKEITVEFEVYDAAGIPKTCCELGGVKKVFSDYTNATFKVAGGEPEVPTAADFGLFTDADQVAKVTEENKVWANEGGYHLEKALLFVSGIDNTVTNACGTEITMAGSDKVLDIPAAHFYDAGNDVNGFVAAVTSIRKDNLDKAFSAKAYVVVDETKVYAEETATATYAE